MIVFDLSCSNGHSFEVWFNANNDYKEQNDKGLLICPYCECNKISKNTFCFYLKGKRFLLEDCTKA